MPRFLPALGGVAVVVVASVIAVNLVPLVGPGASPTPSPFTERSGDWTRTRPQAGPPHVHEIIAGGPGLVAVGAVDAFDDKADIWTSSDARTWSRVAEEALGPGVIDDVTIGGAGLVAVGEGMGRGAVWTSPDGLTWSRVPDDPLFDGRRIASVTAGGPGLVAVGRLNSAWFSSDGLTWTLASIPPVAPDVYPGDDGKTPQVYLSDVAAGGGRLIAIGGEMLRDDSDVAIIWTSTDGMTWTDVPLDRDVFPLGSSVREIIGGPDGFIAIGAETTDWRPAMWTSDDGLRWSRVGSENGPFRSTYLGPDSGEVLLSSVTAGNGGYLAVGSDGPCEEAGDCHSIEAALWTSTDGGSWSRVPPGSLFQSSDAADPEMGTGAAFVVPWRSGFLVMGDYDGERAIWVSEPVAE